MPISDLVRNNKTSKEDRDKILKDSMQNEYSNETQLVSPKSEDLSTEKGEEPSNKKQTIEVKPEEPTAKQTKKENDSVDSTKKKEKDNDIESIVQRVVKSIFMNFSDQKNSQTNTTSLLSSVSNNLFGSLTNNSLFNGAKSLFSTNESNTTNNSIMSNIFKGLSGVINPVSSVVKGMGDQLLSSYGITTNVTKNNTTRNPITENKNKTEIKNESIQNNISNTDTQNVNNNKNSKTNNQQNYEISDNRSNDLIQNLNQSNISAQLTTNKNIKTLQTNSEMMKSIQLMDSQRNIKQTVQNTKPTMSQQSRLNPSTTLDRPGGSRRNKPTSKSGKSFMQYYAMHSMSLPVWRIRNG